MDLSQYSNLLKNLSLIPVFVGLLCFIDDFIPNKTELTQVVSKNDSYRMKTNTTTYTIVFERIDDQFTKEIYEQLKVEDKVALSMTYFNQQIVEIKRLSDNKVFKNTTYEKYAIYLFGILFLMCGFAFFKKEDLSKTQSKYLAILIIFSFIMGFRMFL